MSQKDLGRPQTPPSPPPQSIPVDDASGSLSHQPLSPATPAENFFLSQLGTGDISALALAAEINREQQKQTSLSSGRSNASGTSLATDDFESACASHNSGSDLLEEVPFGSHEDSPNGFFGKDVLVIAREPIAEEAEEEEDPPEEEREFVSSMASKKSAKKPAAVAPAAGAKAAPGAVMNPKPAKGKTMPSPASIVLDSKPTVETAAAAPAVPSGQKAEEQEDHRFDVTQHVYEGAKGLWSFGKNIGIVRPFLGIAEGVASKVVGIATGLELTNVDEGIETHVAGFDNDFLNPAINAVVHFIAPAVQKGGSMVGPIVMPIVTTVLGPLGLFKEQDTGTAQVFHITDGKESEEKTKKDKEKEAIAPEVTMPASAPVVH